MQKPNPVSALLHMMGHPAFCVSDGIITAANEAALGRLITIGAPVLPMLLTGKDEYAAFDGGRLCLTLSVSGIECDATVRTVDGVHVFSLEPDHSDAQLQVLSLAAQQLRNPLSSIKAMMDQLLPHLESAPNSSTETQLAYLYRAMNQMQRIIYNMSDVDRYSSTPAKMSVRDVNAVLTELFERSGALCEHAGITLRYTGPNAPVYSLIDSERLERCVYNILSNSMKHTPSGGSIHATLKRSNSMLFLTVQDSGSGIDLDEASELYTRYLREPGLNMPDSGLGLGMSMIRSCARVHKGAVLLSSARGKGLRLTMSLRIQLDSTLASPSIQFDYAGDQDHGLIELSDSLPPELYQPTKL